jgi:murein DD-endopeptidase MepM/ murein hydrolase activator NlpD
VSAARTKAKSTQVSVASEARVIAYRAEQQAALRDELVTNRQALAGARSSKQRDLAATRQQEREWVGEAKSLASVSAQLASQIAGAQSAPSDGGSSAPPSSGGLIWPCAGPITSPFGMRWGSLHPGIDIGAPTGTPIKAAASGRVLTASYNGGYGNLVVLDNGNGIATAYAHQSQIAVSVGETVTQGQVIGYVGSTGFSTGPHLHFEVRVNGSPVDPMGYL